MFCPEWFSDLSLFLLEYLTHWRIGWMFPLSICCFILNNKNKHRGVMHYFLYHISLGRSNVRLSYTLPWDTKSFPRDRILWERHEKEKCNYRKRVIHNTSVLPRKIHFRIEKSHFCLYQNKPDNSRIGFYGKGLDWWPCCIHGSQSKYCCSVY